MPYSKRHKQSYLEWCPKGCGGDRKAPAIGLCQSKVEKLMSFTIIIDYRKNLTNCLPGRLGGKSEE